VKLLDNSLLEIPLRKCSFLRKPTPRPNPPILPNTFIFLLLVDHYFVGRVPVLQVRGDVLFQTVTLNLISSSKKVTREDEFNYSTRTYVVNAIMRIESMHNDIESMQLCVSNLIISYSHTSNVSESITASNFHISCSTYQSHLSF
jgi:hypothetical protein